MLMLKLAENSLMKSKASFFFALTFISTICQNLLSNGWAQQAGPIVRCYNRAADSNYEFVIGREAEGTHRGTFQYQDGFSGRSPIRVSSPLIMSAERLPSGGCEITLRLRESASSSDLEIKMTYDADIHMLPSGQVQLQEGKTAVQGKYNGKEIHLPQRERSYVITGPDAGKYMEFVTYKLVCEGSPEYFTGFDACKTDSGRRQAPIPTNTSAAGSSPSVTQSLSKGTLPQSDAGSSFPASEAQPAATAK